MYANKDTAKNTKKPKNNNNNNKTQLGCNHVHL